MIDYDSSDCAFLRSPISNSHEKAVKVDAGNSTFEDKLPLNFPNASTQESVQIYRGATKGKVANGNVNRP